jgi:hypothetical protein
MATTCYTTPLCTLPAVMFLMWCYAWSVTSLPVLMFRLFSGALPISTLGKFWHFATTPIWTPMTITWWRMGLQWNGKHKNCSLVLTVCCVKIWAHSAILCVNRMRPESNAPLVAVTLTEFVCGLNRMHTRSIRHFWIVLLSLLITLFIYFLILSSINPHPYSLLLTLILILSY